ncbi:hypothetical protein TWF730_010698 [Orbilia blumenaviensis]|uniref:Uncharacterized protein n=1 Tax=Orbilia blumenaviensis TaxID=1796055 RepID=A0AAV9USF6_9PEZI
MPSQQVLVPLGEASQMVASQKVNGHLLFFLLVAIGNFAMVFHGTTILALSMALALLKFSPLLVLTHMFFKHPETYTALASATLLFVGELVSILGNHFHGLFIDWMEGHPGLQDFLDQVSKEGLGQWIQDLAVQTAGPTPSSTPGPTTPTSPAMTVNIDTALNGENVVLGIEVCGPNSSASDEAELGSRLDVEDSLTAGAGFSAGESGPVTVPKYRLYNPIQMVYSRWSRIRDPETPCPKRAVRTGGESPTTPPIRLLWTPRAPTPPASPILAAIPAPQYPTPPEECETLAELVACSIPEPRPERSVVQRYASGNTGYLRPPPGFEGVVPPTVPIWFTMSPTIRRETPLRRVSKFAHLWWGPRQSNFGDGGVDGLPS